MRSRRHRSTSTPANGPSTEYGTMSTAVALAKPTAVSCLSGPNTTEATITAWNSPSASWLTIRVANSHRKSRDSRTSRARASVVPRFTAPPPRGAALRGLDVEEGGPVGALGGPVADDELLDHLPGGLVGELHRGRLHEVGRGPDQRPGHPAVQGHPGGADRVDHDPRRVRRVPHLELQLDVQRHVAERLALQPDLGPLAVLQPRHVVRRADVDVRLVQRLAELRLHRLRLGLLLREQALSLQHVHEVHVAAEVQLVGPVQPDAAVLEQLGEDAVHDRGAHLALDVVAHDGEPRLGELPGDRKSTRLNSSHGSSSYAVFC